jgi:mevalonate kinase
MAFGAGKVILFGEHAVVYGEPAVAAALDIGIGVASAAPSASLSFRVPQWGTTTTRDDGTRPGESLDRILRVLEETVGELAPLELCLDIGLPVGAGLGSSAALAICLARGFLDAAAPELAAAARTELVLAASAASEAVFHGSPSGVDHTTSVLGGFVRYQREAGGRPRFEPVLGVAPFELVIAQMDRGADTRAMVEAVAALRKRQPALVPKLIALLGETAEASIGPLERGDRTQIGELMNLAHGALVAVGVSTARLDAGCHAARSAGALGAKLTGAGGGGCVIALPRPGEAETLADVLRAAGALEVLTTTLGSP